MNDDTIRWTERCASMWSDEERSATLEELREEWDDPSLVRSLIDRIAQLERDLAAASAEVESLRHDAAQFCGDNERLIKATGAETVLGALEAITLYRDQCHQAEQERDAARAEVAQWEAASKVSTAEREKLVGDAIAARAELAAERIENAHLREAFITMERAANEREAEAARLRELLREARSVFPDYIHPEDESWNWAWDELSDSAQDQVKDMLAKVLAALEGA